VEISLKENSAAKRYAAGLVKTLADAGEYEAVKKELETFLELLNSINEFKAGMETFLLSQMQKKEMLDALNEKVKFSQKTYKFLLTVMDANRLPSLAAIIEMLEDLWYEKNNIEKLKVFSAVALSSKLEKKLLEKLESAFKRKIVLEKEIDPTLIAGLKIQRGLVFYDFSIEGNLKKLKEALTADAARGAASAVGEH